MSLPTPWGAYIAGHPSNTSTTLYDFTGNGRNATMSGITNSIGKTNGATAIIPYITGSTSSTIVWPSGSVPTTFTICSITSYVQGGINGRIFDGQGLNWLHGHWSGRVGLALYNQWMTQTSGNSPNVSSSTNWLVFCGTNTGTTPNNILVNGVGNGTLTGGQGNLKLTINAGIYSSSESSTFAFQTVLIWDVGLTETQKLQVSNLLTSYLATGTITYPWSGGPTYSYLQPTYPYNINNSNILLYYPFDIDFLDYQSGSGIADTVTTNNATITSGVTVLSSGSVYFSGSSTEVVQVPAVTFNTNGITFAFWLKFPTVPTAGFTGIFDFGSGVSNKNIILWYSVASLYFTIYNPSSGTGQTNYSLNYTLGDTNWHHYCITISPTGTWGLYVDGNSIPGINFTAYPSTAQLTTCLLAKSSYQTTNLNAYMNQFILFNRVLTMFEVFCLAYYPSQTQISSAPSTTPYPCFLEGSKILRINPETYAEEYVCVETLRRGDLIVTSESGYQPIHSIGYKTIMNPKSDPNPSNRLYKFSSEKCPSMFEPLYITGEHCTLHRKIPDAKREQITKHMGDVYITEEFYRMPAFLDDRAEEYDGEDRPATIWHFALEHENVTFNYGVWANGLLVESCAIESLLEKSGMILREP